MDETQDTPTVAASYPRAQLAKAFTTAVLHPDPAVRRGARERSRGWRDVLAGLADGTLDIGSRTPVRGLPAWVTPRVLRGGFATGSAAAEGPLEPYEREAARAAGLPEQRGALFAYSLTEPGLARLWALLDSGRYAVQVPEEAALLTVAWLVGAGETGAALELVDQLRPFADRLRFTPRPATGPAPDPGMLHRRTVADTALALRRRRPNPAIETQREALAVWHPFGDEVLTHWLETCGEDGRALGREPDADWQRRSAELLARYRELAQAHPYCGKHRNPKQNLGVLLGCLEETAGGRPLDPRRLGLLRQAVTAMVRRRGRPGSDRHTALRQEQARQAALPSHHRLAQLVLRRLTPLPQLTGLVGFDPVLAPVTAAEESETGLPAGAVIPPAIRRVVETALSAPIGTLVERGVVPSAEVLAELVPQLVAVTAGRAYPDPALRTLMTTHHRAFSDRRSLLLLNLERQVRMEELPWVRAVAERRHGAAGAPDALAALRQLGELAVAAFPATVLPNPLIRELGVLARQSGLEVPLVEELAADIFMGTFSPKFASAAAIAAELLEGSLYARYYGIDGAAVWALGASPAAPRSGTGTLRGSGPNRGYDTNRGARFAGMCAVRAGGPTLSRSVAANGRVIEQSQILTTHNLAVLVAVVGIAPEPGWADLAFRSFRTVCRLTARLQDNPRPLPTVKDAAYAWRQMLFHLAQCPEAEQRDLIDHLPEEARRYPAHVAARLEPALAGLRLVAGGGEFTPEGTARVAGLPGPARRFLGWTTGGHWLVPDPFGPPVAS
ncbi:hypothetical protein [Kitasatospora camelliae]|uniref:Uncharacterized protein n=1 Tax=Kitasatospora camelliae TaxID=3156397 RepID=A0AAU8K795_9ACTN